MSYSNLCKRNYCSKCPTAISVKKLPQQMFYSNLCERNYCSKCFTAISVREVTAANAFQSNGYHLQLPLTTVQPPSNVLRLRIKIEVVVILKVLRPCRKHYRHIFEPASNHIALIVNKTWQVINPSYDIQIDR